MAPGILEIRNNAHLSAKEEQGKMSLEQDLMANTTTPKDTTTIQSAMYYLEHIPL
jgi:hypothetical protein